MVIKNPAPYKALAKPFTRTSRVKSKAYIKTVPPKVVVKFVMGNASKYNVGGYRFKVFIISKEDSQIRDVALESGRAHFHRDIEENIGTDYYMAVSVAPHHILREHKQAAVAQADRMSQGMSLSFGKSVGKAARVHKGKALYTFGFNTEEDVRKFRGLYERTKSKFNMVTLFEVQDTQKPNKLLIKEAEAQA